MARGIIAASEKGQEKESSIIPIIIFLIVIGIAIFLILAVFGSSQPL